MRIESDMAAMAERLVRLEDRVATIGQRHDQQTRARLILERDLRALTTRVAVIERADAPLAINAPQWTPEHLAKIEAEMLQPGPIQYLQEPSSAAPFGILGAPPPGWYCQAEENVFELFSVKQTMRLWKAGATNIKLVRKAGLFGDYVSIDIDKAGKLRQAIPYMKPGPSREEQVETWTDELCRTIAKVRTAKQQPDAVPLATGRAATANHPTFKPRGMVDVAISGDSPKTMADVAAKVGGIADLTALTQAELNRRRSAEYEMMPFTPDMEAYFALVDEMNRCLGSEFVDEWFKAKLVPLYDAIGRPDRPK